jgi:peroxiredoxin
MIHKMKSTHASLKQFLKIFSMLLFCLVIFSGVAVAGREPLHLVKGMPLAPDFDLMDVDGQRHTLAMHRGKIVIVNFWATWCPPCRFELPAMEKVWERLKDKGVVILGINVGEDADTIFTFTADYPVTFPLLMDSDSSVTNAYPVIGLPTTYVINPQGKLVYKAIGTRDWNENALVKKILELQQSTQ